MTILNIKKVNVKAQGRRIISFVSKVYAVIALLHAFITCKDLDVRCFFSYLLNKKIYWHKVRPKIELTYDFLLSLVIYM